MEAPGLSLLFLAKAGDPLAQAAGEYLAAHLDAVEVHACARGEPLPEPGAEAYDWIVSYLCPRVIPARLLRRARVAALNFHPGPPEYPGIGCTNFALYDGVGEFGVTCHHMAPRVDSGEIVAVRRFPVLESDSVLSLTRRAHASLADLFYEVAAAILAGKPLPASPESWTREPYRRAELEALCRVTPEMDPGEIRRRVRATTYPDWPGAFVELGGHRFEIARG